MQLRPYQQRIVDAVTAVFREKASTLAVAPTGAGKTVILAACAEAMETLLGRPARVLVLQHRLELLDQNRETFLAYSGRDASEAGTVQGETRELDRPFVFAMVQTMAGLLHRMPFFDAIFVDEAHHAPAETYVATLKAARAVNPGLKVLGVTATPTRSGKRRLREVFNNCAGAVDLVELLESGILVRPRVLVQATGAEDELAGTDAPEWGDQSAVAEVMSRELVTDAVLRAWQLHAGDRQTVAFCPDIASSEHYARAFSQAGISATCVHSKLKEQDRADRLADFKAGRIQVIFNPLTLTEGFDHQPTACVMLLRKSSEKSTLVQMVGRGLRRVDPSRFPGIVKTDCVVLDFGASFLKHSDLFTPLDLADRPAGSGEAPKKECRACGYECALACRECPDCGAPFPVRRQVGANIVEVTMVPKEILARSPFRWLSLNRGAVMVASGWTADAFVLERLGLWQAYGYTREDGIRRLYSGDRAEALFQADSFMLGHGDTARASREAAWLGKPATPEQTARLSSLLPQLASSGVEVPKKRGRYTTSCLLSLGWRWRAIERLSGVAA